MQKIKYLTFKLKQRNDLISGIVLARRNGWTLIQRCIDYQIDGYSLIKSELITAQFYDQKEKLASKILTKKYSDRKKVLPIKLTTLDDMLTNIQRQYSLIQLDSKKGDAFDVVKYLGSERTVYVFRELTINAKWRYKLSLDNKAVTVVSFDNDYLKSLLLVI